MNSAKRITILIILLLLISNIININTIIYGENTNHKKPKEIINTSETITTTVVAIQEQPYSDMYDAERGKMIREDVPSKIINYISIQNPSLGKEDVYGIKDSIILNSKENGFDPLLISAVVCVESHFQEDLTSSAGAKGIMQILPSTAQSVADRYGITNFNLSKYEDNINIGTKCLYIYVNSWKDIKQFDVRTNRPFDCLQMGLLSYNGGTVNAGKLENLEYLYLIEDEYYDLKHTSIY